MTLIQQVTADRLQVKVFESRKEMGQAAASEAAGKIRILLSEQGTLNIIFAAAPSQNEFLTALTAEKDIDWARINAFHMDEYIGIAPDAPQGFGNFLKFLLFSRLPFKAVHYINGNALDPEAECRRYANLLKENPSDLVCMGIGENGHLAFNDPPAADFQDPVLVKIVSLDAICRQQQVNDGCFETLEQVPTHAVTLSIPALLQGRFIYCMVPAKTKAEAVSKTVTGPITEACPASILRTHSNAVLYTDKDSAALVLEG